MGLPGYLTIGFGDGIINTLMAGERVDVPGLIGELTLGRKPDDPTSVHIRSVLGAYSEVHRALLFLSQTVLVLTPDSRVNYSEILRMRDATYKASRNLRLALTGLINPGVVGMVEQAVGQNFILDRNQSTGSAIRTQLTFLDR